MMEMKKLFQKISLDIVHMDHVLLSRKEWLYKNFSQNFSKIYLIKQGKGVVRYPDKEIVLEPERLYLIPPFKPADYLVLEQPLEQYFIHFYAKFDNNINIFSLINFNSSILPESPETITHLFERLNKIYSAPSDFVRVEADAILRYFIALLRRETTAAEIENTMRNIKRFEPVLDYLEENFTRKITLRELADMIHLQPNYFSTAFTKVLGSSPVEFIISKRLDKAQELLFFSSLSVKEIAAEVGFKDEFYFSRIFKKYLDISPAKYRQRRKM